MRFLSKIKFFFRNLKSGINNLWFILNEVVTGKLRRKLLKIENLNYEIGTKGIIIPNILSEVDTIEYCRKNRVGLSRFGDGEFQLMKDIGRTPGFQSHDQELKKRLREIISGERVKNTLVSIPNIFGDLSSYKDFASYFWRGYLVLERTNIYSMLNFKYVYGDAMCSRPYMDCGDTEKAKKIFDKWKELFFKKKILIIEGEKTRFGVGNDLLQGVESIGRLLCPAKNAFSVYSVILSKAKAIASAYDMVLIALGPTASVLSCDLGEEGYWAIDTGHLDVEYSWFLMQATEKCTVLGKYVNEAGGMSADMSLELLSEYNKQIVEKVA